MRMSLVLAIRVGLGKATQAILLEHTTQAVVCLLVFCRVFQRFELPFSLECLFLIPGVGRDKPLRSSKD